MIGGAALLRVAVRCRGSYPTLWQFLYRPALALRHLSVVDRLVRLAFPNGTSVLLNAGAYEPDTQIVFAKYCRPGSVVFDIGANTGQYTQLAARLVGKRGRVFAFEPVPNTAEVLDVQVKASSINKLYEYSEL